MTTQAIENETILSQALIQIVLVVSFACLCNNIFRRLGQPGVVGEIIAGIILGPSVLGYFYPQLGRSLFTAAAAGPTSVISQIGLTLLMFQVGMDTKFGQIHTRQERAAVGWVALASIVVPFVSGLCFGLLSASSLAPAVDRLTYSVFCGIAMSITAVPILGRILQEFGLTQHAMGAVAISAAAINDLVGWLLLATVTAYTRSAFTGEFVLVKLGALILGGCLIWWILRPMVKWLLSVAPLQRGKISPNLMAAALCLIFTLGLCSSALGIFTIFGGFVAGLLFQDQAEFSEAWHLQVHSFVLVLLLPLFFASTGLHTNLRGLQSKNDTEWLVLVVLLSTAGKIVPVYGAARACGFDRWRSLTLGSLMNTRGLMELIVLNVGYDLGYLPQSVFTMLVVMAVTTTIMIGPLLRLLVPRIGQRTADFVHL